MNAEEMRNYAGTLGFTLTGIARIEPTPEGAFYPEWLDRGYAGEMHYLERQKAARMDPQSVLPGQIPVFTCSRTGSDHGHRVFSDIGADTAACDGLRPLTDTDNAAVAWKLGNQGPCQPRAPSPVVRHDVRRRAMLAHTVAKRLYEFSDAIGSGAFRTSGTPAAMRETVGVILRHGDCQDATQAWSLTEDMTQTFAQPITYLVRRCAHRENILIFGAS